MAIVTKQWQDGSGFVTVTYGGSGDGTISVVSDANTIYEQRSMDITIQTTAGSPQQTKTITISQAAKLRIDISTAVVTCANQTYSGSALTPTPTVTLNGVTIPSTGYDVTYSNNTNAGTATVTVVGKGDYTGTASGTFAIAQAIGQVTTAPTARSVTYSGSAQYLVVAGSGTGTMQYRYKLDSASSWSSWSTTRARATNAGTYNVQYRAAASSDGNYTVSAVGELNVTMAKRTPVINVAPTIVTGLVYTGSAQNLLTGGSMKHSSSSSTAVAGTFTYTQQTNAGTYSNPTWNFTPTDTTNYNTKSGRVTGSVSIAKADSIYTAPVAQSLTYSGSSQYLTTIGSTSHGTIQYSSDNSNWYTTRRTGTNAGSYTTYWRLVGDSNHNDVASTSISVTIAKATPTYTAPTKKTNLVYTGSAQALLNAGSTSHGTIYYSSDNSTWGTTIPTKTNANTSGYTVYWKLTGDSNHSNIASTAITGITIAKASRTIAFTNPTTTVPTSASVTNTATVSAGNGDGAITYSISSTTYATINSSTGKVTAKTSAGSATVTATVAEGTNYLSASTTYTIQVKADITTYTIDQRKNGAGNTWKTPSDVIIKDVASMNATATCELNGETVYQDVIRRIRQKSVIVAGKYENGTLVCFECSQTDSTKKKSDNSTIDYASNGLDCFMKLPKFYWKVTETQTDVYEVSFAMSNIDNTYNEWAGDTFIGVHEAYSNGSVIVSRPGVTPSVSLSYANFKTLSQAKGGNGDFTFVTLEAHNMMALLSYGYLGTTDSQSVCGKGTSSYPKTTAAVNLTTDTNTTTGNAGSINFWGLENWWGDIIEMLSNVKMSSNYNVDVLEKDLTTVKRTITTGITATTNDEEIKQLVLGQYGDVIPKLCEANSSYNKGFADSGTLNATSGRYGRRSGSSNTSYGGINYIYFSNAASGTNAQWGSRLLYQGSYTLG